MPLLHVERWSSIPLADPGLAGSPFADTAVPPRIGTMAT